MSLCSTYVEATDGNFYKDPVFRGEGWFVCFDDEEPPELVVAADQDPPLATNEIEAMARKILLEANIKYTSLQRNSTAIRVFGDDLKKSAYRRAVSFFFDLRGPTPVPLGQKPVTNTKKIAGVIYRF